MPRRFERHARSRWEWGTEPGRSAQRTEAVAEGVREPARKAPARKDTRSWCRGKVGTEHIPVIVIDHTAPHFTPGPQCEWKASWDWRTNAYFVYWACPHHEICGQCQKVLRDRFNVLAHECPFYPGGSGQRAAVEASIPELERQQRERLARQRLRPKRVITGPQGYRRQRASGKA